MRRGSTRRKNVVKAIVAAALLMLGSMSLPLAFVVVTNVPALAAAPAYTTSRYANDMTGNPSTDYNTFRNYGCGQASLGGVVILAFGQHSIRNGVNGIYTLNGIFVPYSGVESAAEGFAAGWYACSPTGIYLDLGIGVNNYGSYVNSSTGADWANVAKNAAAWVADRGYNSQVMVWGAVDIEPSWNSTTNTRAWADGYGGVTGRPSYYDFGSADGCPTSGTGSGTDGTCNNGWRQSDVWYVSWGVSPAWPLPQIYNTTGANAKQWQQISLYGYYNQSRNTLYFPGEMTQYQACEQRGGCPGANNQPAEGWQQLYDALNCYGSTPCPTAQSSLPYSTDIKWDVK